MSRPSSGSCSLISNPVVVCRVVTATSPSTSPTRPYHRGHERREIDDLHCALGLDGEHGAVYDGDRRGRCDAHHRSSVAGPPARTRPGPAKTSSQDTRAVICISTNRVSTAPMVIARPVMPWKKNA